MLIKLMILFDDSLDQLIYVAAIQYLTKCWSQSIIGDSNSNLFICIPNSNSCEEFFKRNVFLEQLE